MLSDADGPSQDTGQSANGLRPGVRLALDWGKARIGVAACDAEGVLCYPVETVPNNKRALARLTELVRQYRPIELILGLPTDLHGRAGIAAQVMERVAQDLASQIGLPVRLSDERLTTALSARRLRQAGRGGARYREVIDQAAAVAILESSLASERRTGRPTGRLVEPPQDERRPR